MGGRYGGHPPRRGDRGDILRLTRQRIVGGVAARAAAAAVERQHGEALAQGGQDGRPAGVVGGRPVHEHERRAVPAAPDGDGGGVGGGDELELLAARNEGGGSSHVGDGRPRTLPPVSGSGASVLGHSYGGVCALEAALLTDAIERLVLYEAPVGFVQTPADVVGRLNALDEAGRYDELLALFFAEVAGLPPEQIELLRGLPAWANRVAAAPTISREERANREYAFAPERFASLGLPTLLLAGGDSPAPFAAATAALEAALPASRTAVMPGQRHAAMDTGTELFLAEVLGFLARSG